MANNEGTPIYESFDSAVDAAWLAYWGAVRMAQKVFREASDMAGADYEEAEKTAREARIKAIAAAKDLYNVADYRAQQRAFTGRGAIVEPED